MDNRPIGMFDSGVGGITVFREITSILPDEDVIYIGDTLSFPYGSKSKDMIVELCTQQIKKLIEMNVKLIVIACGTATSQALEEMQAMFDVPIIGIIEPTVQYLKGRNFRRVGIIATAGTIRSRGWEKAIESQNPDCVIQSRACSLLAPMAEEGWTKNDIARLTIREYLKGFENIESLVLGCTHYPLFQDLIAKELPKGTEVINTGKLVAKHVKEYLAQHNIEKEDGHEAQYEIYLTDVECNFVKVAEELVQDSSIVKNIKKI